MNQNPSFKIILLLATLLAAPASNAEMCTLDVVPAATLLLPYFEVNLDSQQGVNGVNTLFSINNASPEPTIAHVTFWTNYGYPTIDFDIFLTGYDVQQVSMLAAFEGFLPVTADEQTDPSDAISPHGNNPEWDGSFAAPPNCAFFFPFFNPVIPQINLERMILGHTGKTSANLDNRCLGADFGDNIARGYVTVDVARRCSIEFPSDNGYFGGADPVAIDDNRLWGDFIIRQPELDTAARSHLVHIEADPSFDNTSTASGLTFYGRYSGGADHREPLGMQWGARYYGTSLSGNNLLVWRDSTQAQPNLQGYDCAEGPPWLPLDETSVLCFDEEESFVELCAEGETCFPLETQRVFMRGEDLPIPYLFGWCQLDLNHDDDFVGDVDFPTAGSPVAQSYVAVLHDQSGVFGGITQGVSLGGACHLPTSFSDIFIDGFESGDTSAWSN